MLIFHKYTFINVEYYILKNINSIYLILNNYQSKNKLFQIKCYHVINNILKNIYIYEIFNFNYINILSI